MNAVEDDSGIADLALEVGNLALVNNGTAITATGDVSSRAGSDTRARVKGGACGGRGFRGTVEKLNGELKGAQQGVGKGRGRGQKKEEREEEQKQIAELLTLHDSTSSHETDPGAEAEAEADDEEESEDKMTDNTTNNQSNFRAKSKSKAILNSNSHSTSTSHNSNTLPSSSTSRMQGTDTGDEEGNTRVIRSTRSTMAPLTTGVKRATRVKSNQSDE